MKTIIHDFDPAVFEELFPETALLTRLGTSEPPAVILSPMYPARPCIGCFGCWIKTPGSCVLPDSYQEMGKLLSRTSELILISRCCYGSYSPHVKNVLDRSIPYVHPYFRIIRKEMHHKKRYLNTFQLQVCFYGSGLTEEEKETAVSVAEANALNLSCELCSVDFLSLQELTEGNYVKNCFD